jgi:hypothetical protein
MYIGTHQLTKQKFLPSRTLYIPVGRKQTIYPKETKE